MTTSCYVYATKSQCFSVLSFGQAGFINCSDHIFNIECFLPIIALSFQFLVGFDMDGSGYNALVNMIRYLVFFKCMSKQAFLKEIHSYYFRCRSKSSSRILHT